MKQPRSTRIVPEDIGFWRRDILLSDRGLLGQQKAQPKPSSVWHPPPKRMTKAGFGRNALLESGQLAAVALATQRRDFVPDRHGDRKRRRDDPIVPVVGPGDDFESSIEMLHSR
jgi:hypothetical protein